MSVAQRLTDDLKSAMLSGDVRRRDVIRFLRSAVKNAEIDLRRDLNDAEIQDVIRTQIKQRRDSVDMFRRGGRAELADEEEAQIAVLQTYLPQPIDEQELREIVRAQADALGASGPRDMGRLMPALMAATNGRAEGRVLSQLAREELERRAEPSS